VLKAGENFILFFGGRGVEIVAEEVLDRCEDEEIQLPGACLRFCRIAF
jgi:hypothetical protein